MIIPQNPNTDCRNINSDRLQLDKGTIPSVYLTDTSDVKSYYTYLVPVNNTTSPIIPYLDAGAADSFMSNHSTQAIDNYSRTVFVDHVYYG